MAQLELANFSSASGATGAVSTPTAEAAGRAEGPSLSFGRLLQGGTSREPAAAELATRRAGNGAAPIAANPPASQDDGTAPAALGKAGVGQQIEVAALAAGILGLAGEGEPGEAEETGGEIDTGNSDIAEGEASGEAMPWPGLPLFVEARAALREVGSSGAEPSSSDVAAAADSIDAARLRFMLCSATAPARSAGGGQSALPTTTDSSVGASSGSAVSVPSNLAEASLDGSSAPKVASGQLADDARKAARLVGDRESGILVDGSRSSMPIKAVEMASESSPPAMDTAVEIASTVSVSLDGRTANWADGSGGAAARPANFWSRFGPPAATGPATLATADLAAAGIEAVIAPSMTASTVDAPTATATAEDASVATGWAGIVGDQHAARLASGRSFRWHPHLAGALADPLARAEAGLLASDRSVSVENLVSADQVRRAMAFAATENVGDADRPPAPAGQDAFSLAISARARQQQPVDAAAPAALLPEESVRDAATLRVGEPTVPANGPAFVRFGSPPAALVRPDTGTSPTTSLPVAPEVLNFGQKNWERALGHQLNWMVNNRLQEVEIKVDPPNLGPLEVRVSLHQNQTSVTFFSHEAAVREAIENALPRLRDMLDGQGISLNQAQVSDQSLARQQAGTGEQSPYGQRDGRSPTTAQRSETDEGATESRPRPRSVLGMVDDYA